MAEDRNSYGSITKSIGIFGGTKVFQILVSLLQNKVIAIILGPTGMGIQGMLMSTINLVKSLTGLGLHTSAVRDVAKAHSSQNEERISTTVSILRKLVVLTGLLGFLLVFIFAPLLSRWSFGDYSFTNTYRIIAIVLFFDQLVVGQTVLLQGTFHYKYMALASLWGSVIGLVVSIPLYYFFSRDAIGPVIIIVSICYLIISSYYAKRIPYRVKKLSWCEIWSNGKIMITLGLALALSGVVNTGTIYAVRSFLTNWGSLETVGLYTAGSGIATQYVNVILQSMGSDYSPRLAAASTDRVLFIETINRQANLLVTMLSPLVIIFVVFAPKLIIILFSSKFIPIIGMIEWMMAGMLFRALSWSMSYSFAARGDSSVFFINELLSSITSLILTVLGYLVYGYEGIGIAFCLTYIIYTLQVYIITKIKFNFAFNHEVVRKVFPLIAITFSMVIIVSLIKDSLLRYLLGIVFIMLIIIIVYRRLNVMLGIAEKFKKKKYGKSK